MAIDITTSGNYIIFTSDDFTPNREQRYPKKEVRYGRSDVNDQTYVFYHNNNSINNLIEVLWSDFTNDSVAFATQEDFETLLDDETGSQGSGGGSGSSSWGSITGDINTQTDLINLVSEITVNGNTSINEFNGTTQLNSNATEYYGCDTILNAGDYTTFELPYRNRNTTTGTAYLYAIILDQSNNTIAYKRLDVTSGGSATGSFVITFDTPVNIAQTGIYQIVIGRRNFNGTNRNLEIFHKDVNSSDGRVWVAYAGSNNALNTNDTSAVNWGNISKQNFNRIPQNLIYRA